MKVFHLIVTLLTLFTIQNMRNDRFRRYIKETGNYPLFALPLIHRPIYNQDLQVGFISRIAFLKIIIAMYIEPSFRSRGLALKTLEDQDILILTSKKWIVKRLQEAGGKMLVDIPYFRLIYRKQCKDTVSNVP